MKKTLLNLRNFFLLIIAGIILSSCSKDETIKTDLVGTWTAGAPTITIMVGTKTLLQYFTDVMGLSPTEAAQYTSMFDQGVQQSFTGTIQMKADNTYTANMGGEPDSGTWSLSADAKKLTIDPINDDPTTFDILELTASKLRFKISETMNEDINADNIMETLDIAIGMTFTR